MKAVLTLAMLFVGLSSLPVAGMEACSHLTPVGTACFCNTGVLKHKPLPGWERQFGQLYTRPGWHATNTKGMHSSGNTCYRDRAPTEQERAEYHARHRLRSFVLILEPVRLERARLLVDDVAGEIEHVLGDFNILDIVEVFFWVPYLIRISQKRDAATIKLAD